jgi:integral membrane protein
MTHLLKSNFGRFRIVAFFEGLSYLALFFITMPLKYIYGMGELNKIVGMAHGVLFILYALLLIPVKSEENWSYRKTFKAFIASLLPFGTFWAEKNLYHK